MPFIDMINHDAKASVIVNYDDETDTVRVIATTDIPAETPVFSFYHSSRSVGRRPIPHCYRG